MQRQYSLQQCKVNYNKAKLCVPSTKKIIKTTAQYPFNYLYGTQPQQLFNDFICYNLKCKPQRLLAFQGAADQFGYKRIMFANKFRLCVPAWKFTASGPIVIGWLIMPCSTAGNCRRHLKQYWALKEIYIKPCFLQVLISALLVSLLLQNTTMIMIIMTMIHVILLPRTRHKLERSSNRQHWINIISHTHYFKK